MRLTHAHISNFKLLEDVELDFSTDPDRPLTAIRAENGSGKTSLLHALRWAIWGQEAIPAGMRLTSSEKPIGKPVNVQVRLEFEESDIYSSEITHYRLISTCQETPRENNTYHRSEVNSRLYKLTPEGDQQVSGVEGQIHAIFPFNLSNIFFTNGDAVQNFISANTQSGRPRQERVHQAIREVLGLPRVEQAVSLLDSVTTRFKRAIVTDGSTDLKINHNKLENINKDLQEQKTQLSETETGLQAIEDYIRQDERELDQIKGIGDLEHIQSQIHGAESDLKTLDNREIAIRNQMRRIFESEELSIHYLKDQLEPGREVLKELTDLKVIPGISVGILQDRLELKLCICGEKLNPGTLRHDHINELIEQQKKTESWKDRLSVLNHEARRIAEKGTSDQKSGSSLKNEIDVLKEELANCRDQKLEKNDDLEALKARRSRIDEDRVQILTNRLKSSQADKDIHNQRIGAVNSKIQELEAEKTILEKEIDESLKKENLNETTQKQLKVAEDLKTLSSGILEHLKQDKIQQVSKAMNGLFLDIVGADTTAQANLLADVHIADSYDIIITTQTGSNLDPDSELYGAAQRALTLSLIWALMEVTGKESPRIIDTPLGMTSGTVKTRMVDILTAPVTSDKPRYQVILFMTRSEIRDIEELLEQRTGKAITLSCSKDFPKDLVNNWGAVEPTIRACACNHAQYCSVCQRHTDKSRLVHRES